MRCEEMILKGENRAELAAQRRDKLNNIWQCTLSLITDIGLLRLFRILFR
jgi:hypothetical protein